MIVVGEKLNSSIPATLQALNAKDEAALIRLIKAQEEAGADYLDINTALCVHGEEESLVWLTQLAIKHSCCGIMLDSPSPKAMKAAAAVVKDRPLIFNSVTLTERIDQIAPLAKNMGAGVVGLPIDEKGIPEDPDTRTENALKLVQKLREYDLDYSQIYIDILAQAISVGSENARNALYALYRMKTYCPEANTICGISNVSFGLPGRVHINCAFLTAAYLTGLSSAIMDITSPSIRKALAAVRALAGDDEYCLEYIGVIRQMAD